MKFNQKIKAELDRLKAASDDGLLRVKDVVDAAKDKKNPLHDCFTWDRDKAFEANLLNEARQLIQRYTVVVVGTNVEPMKTRQFVSLTTDRVAGGGYRAVGDVLDDAELKQQLLADALGELASIRAKYRAVNELSAVFNEIAALETKVLAPKKKRA